MRLSLIAGKFCSNLGRVMTFATGLSYIVMSFPEACMRWYPPPAMVLLFCGEVVQTRIPPISDLLSSQIRTL